MDHPFLLVFSKAGVLQCLPTFPGTDIAIYTLPLHRTDLIRKNQI